MGVVTRSSFIARTNSIVNPTMAINELIPADAPWGWLAAIGVPAFGVWLNRQFKIFRSDRADRLAIDSNSEIVTGLREECDRLRVHNTALVTYFQEAQVKIVELAGQYQRAQLTIQEMAAKIERLLAQHGAR